MLSKLNPWAIVEAHFASLRDYESDRHSWAESAFHILFPAVIAGTHFALADALSENVVGIIVSAASIVAGLMLNLLVLIYTLVYNAKNSERPISNFADFKVLAGETLATISYSVLICILLVLFAFFSLSGWTPLAITGRIGAVYFGATEVLCLLIVLKRCYGVIQFEVKR